MEGKPAHDRRHALVIHGRVMDSLTHILFGAALAQTGFRQKLGRRAILAGTVLASLPDLDVVAGWVDGRLAEWEHHRGFTHSLFFAPIFGPLLGWAIARVEQTRAQPPPGDAAGSERLRWWIWLSVLALLSHPILDVFTSYGTQLLSPVTTARFAVDAVAIIDPFYSLLPLLIALIIGARRPAAARRAGLSVFLYMAVYVLAGTMLNQRVERIAAADFGRPAVVNAYPLLFQLFYRRVIAMTPEAAHVGYYSLLNPKPIDWRTYPIDVVDAIVDLRRSREVAVFQWFAMDKVLWRAVRDGEGHTVVEATDLRYGMPGPTDTGNWGIRARIDGTGAIAATPQAFSVPRDASAVALRQFWADMTGW